MKKWLFPYLAPATLALLACTKQEPTPTPTFYERAGVYTSHADVYVDTVRTEDACFDTFSILPCEKEHSPGSRETWFNCNNMGVSRSGDTLFLYGFDYLPPDTVFSWEPYFACHNNPQPFLLQGDGTTKYAGTFKFLGDPDLHFKGDTLFFTMTLTIFDRGGLVEVGEPFYVRYPQFGTMDNLDSIQAYLRTLHDGSYETYKPKFRVAWQKWAYLPHEE